MNTRHTIRRRLVWPALLMLALVAGCGGGDGGVTVGSPVPAAPQAPPPAVVIGTAGGTFNGPDGVTLTIPADALAADTSLQITTATASELLPLPAGVEVAAKMYALLPHGVRFSVAITLTLPRTAGEPGDGVSLLKTNAEGTAWEQLVTSTSDTTYSALITSFSGVGIMCGPGPGGICAGPAAAPPVISMHPISGSVDERGYVLLAVSAIGEQPLRYQWLRNGVPIDLETASAIVINPVSLTDDGMQLSVTVTDPSGRSITSNDGVVTVRAAAPVVVNEPRDEWAVMGTTVVFRAATTSSVLQELRWERQQPGSAAWVDAGSAATDLVLPNVQIATDDQALFRLAARNVGGSVWTMSRAALLTVRPAQTAPAIVQHPRDQTTFFRRSASLEVHATGGALTYQWFRDQYGRIEEVNGATSAQLTISNAALGDDGAQFFVVVSNSQVPAAISVPATLTVQPTPTEATIRLGGGFEHSVGLRGDGTLVAWGRNQDGELGRGTFSLGYTGEEPQPVIGLSDVATFAVGLKHTLAALADGSVHAWGNGEDGQLGDGTRDRRPLAVRVSGFNSDEPARFVAAGYSSSIAVSIPAYSRYARQLWSWGNANHGNGMSRRYLAPQPIFSDARGIGFARATRSFAHTVAIRRDGYLFVWGDNVFGQLGKGDTWARSMPTRIDSPNGILAVATGYVHSLALTVDGRVYAWGGNGNGQVGTGASTSTVLIPMAVSLPGFVVGIAAGSHHSLALLSDGRVYAWGSNRDGQLGSGSLLDSSTPVLIDGGWIARMARIESIGAGDKHSLALDSQGNVWAWGANDRMQLGDGTRTPRNLPVQPQMQGRPLNLN